MIEDPPPQVGDHPLAEPSDGEDTEIDRAGEQDDDSQHHNHGFVENSGISGTEPGVDQIE